MLTNQRLLELIFDAATCYFPSNELSEEQLERFDNITIHWCNCILCRISKFKSNIVIPHVTGHANKATCQIGISKYMHKRGFELTPPIFLLDLISTMVHEIVHVLYPELSEEETHRKTLELLKKNQWLIDEEEILKQKSDLEPHSH